MIIHTCQECKLDKEITEFYKWDIKFCKKCHNKINYQKNKEYYLLKGHKRRNDPEYKEKIRKYDREWKKERRKNFPEERIKHSLRTRLNAVLKGIRKYVHLKDCLGCNIKTLLNHIESQWENGMSWDNYGKKRGEWNVDHIKPMTSFDLTKKEEQLKCNHYTNLKPMWATENSKKGNRVNL